MTVAAVVVLFASVAMVIVVVAVFTLHNKKVHNNLRLKSTTRIGIPRYEPLAPHVGDNNKWLVTL